MRPWIMAAEIIGVVAMTLVIMRTSRTQSGASRPRGYRGHHRIITAPVRTRVRVFLELRALSVLSILPTPTPRSVRHA